MPTIRYFCQNTECKKEFFKFYINAKQLKNIMECPSCGGEGKRTLSAPAQKSVFVVDNGLQTREVELDLNVIESNKERSKKGYNRGD